MSEVKLLPMPEKDNDVAVDGEGNEAFFEFFTEAHMEAYARANMKPLLAENERLRAEVERNSETVTALSKNALYYLDACNAAEARAAQLAEIKDFLRRAAPYARAIVRAQTEAEERAACRALAKLYNDDLDALLSREEG